MRFFQIVADAARNTGVALGAGDIVGAGFGPALEFSHFNLSVRDMLNHTGCRAVQADKAETAQNLFDRKK